MLKFTNTHQLRNSYEYSNDPARHAELAEASLPLRLTNFQRLRQPLYVYILTNTGRTVLYIGVTNDLTRRLHEHRSGNGDVNKFTGRYQVDLLIYFELLPDVSQAIAREKQLKGWTRAKKNSLIATLNPDWIDIDLGMWQG